MSSRICLRRQQFTRCSVSFSNFKKNVPITYKSRNLLLWPFVNSRFDTKCEQQPPDMHNNTSVKVSNVHELGGPQHLFPCLLAIIFPSLTRNDLTPQIQSFTSTSAPTCFSSAGPPSCGWSPRRAVMRGSACCLETQPLQCSEPGPSLVNEAGRRGCLQ